MHGHLTLTRRSKTGKGASRQLRKEGKVPAVLYGQGKAISLTLDPTEFNTVLRLKQRGHVLITLTEANTKDGAKPHAILQDVQYDPISGHALHADLLEVAIDQPIQVAVPIVITGSTPVGITLGGVLQQRCRHLLVEGLPSDIPDTVVFDASRVGIGQVVKVKDIALEKGIMMCEDHDKIVISITATTKESEETERESDGAAHETQASATPTR